MEASDSGLGMLLVMILIFGPILLHNKLYRKKSPVGTGENKRRYHGSIISDGAGKGKKKFRDGGRHKKGGVW